MKLGTIFNALWVALVVVFLLRDFLMGLGLSAGQVGSFAGGLAFLGVVVGWAGFMGAARERLRNRQAPPAEQKRHD